MEDLNQVKDVERWTYKDYLREYLLLIARRGRMAIESIEKFPGKIELSKDWHEMLDTVRKATEDGKERWALVGVREERFSLLLPTIPAVGLESRVPADVIKQEITKARNKFGIVDLIGDVHSHPRNFAEKFLQILPALNTLKLKAQFSPADYYALLVPGQTLAFMGLVEGNYNLFAFRTRQTQDIPMDPKFFKQEFFERFWYEKYGFKYFDGDYKVSAPKVIRIAGKADTVAMTAAIADRHKLVLYQGVKDKELTRIYPKKI